ncbi:MAG TPA: NADH-quinone oxidoreductase subunit N [Candidatus Omnitrophota bacterium]|nr:NADH-quinone oxidoreductase subunit N [Candidatus Omnitrophota bacterium]
MGPVESLRHFIPELILLGGSLTALCLDLFLKGKRYIGWFSVLVLAAASCFLTSPREPLELFYGFFHLDSFANIFRALALIAVAATLLISFGFSPIKKDGQEGEFYGLFLLMAFALITVAAANNLLMIFLTVEFVSILSYLLTGFLKNDPKAKEAAVKYLLFGSFCSGVMLYGMSLLFGAAGSISLPSIGHALNSLPAMKPIATVGLLAFFVGLGFKISMAPFHLWAPDVYEGAPTPVTAFLTVAPKALGFAVLMRVLSAMFGTSPIESPVILMWLSILTMTIGNLTAISQKNIKRLLAYSSIAQAGYILMGLAVFPSTLGRDAILVYLFAYLFTNLGAFAIVTFIGEHTGDDEIASYAGLSRRSPVSAALLTVFLLSLTGLPPLAGFIGKYYVFAAAIEANFILLAVAAALNSAIAAYYYFRIIRVMYLVPPTDPQTSLPKPPVSSSVVTWLMFAGVLGLGLFPACFIRLILN